MIILGIETSCDETAAAVIMDGKQILSNVVATSKELHEKTGGIIPEQAARQQVVSIIPIIQEALAAGCGWEAGIELVVSSKNKKGPGSYNSQAATKSAIQSPPSTPPVDAIAVTVGPGLIGSLLVGVETAKTLSLAWNKPIIPVNHLVGHIYANWLKKKSNVKGQMSKVPSFPALALVVSGGHTDLVLMRGHGKLKWLGGTRDDAAGETFDKTARMLGLPYPGGPSISNEAEKYLSHLPKINGQKLKMFPRPLIEEDNFDWSFSGLKTAVMREYNSRNNNGVQDISVPKFAAEIQEAIVDVLIEKSIRAIKKYKPKSFLLAGGVAANKRLREKFTQRISEEKLELKFFAPPPSLCTDNASYIASSAYYNYYPTNWKKIVANPQLTITGET